LAKRGETRELAHSKIKKNICFTWFHHLLTTIFASFLMDFLWNHLCFGYLVFLWFFRLQKPVNFDQNAKLANSPLSESDFEVILPLLMCFPSSSSLPLHRISIWSSLMLNMCGERLNIPVNMLLGHSLCHSGPTATGNKSRYEAVSS
jgi:hypothetical protein